MADPRTTVQRALGGAEVRPITLDAFHTRRERKRRSQRLAAGILGVSIAVAGALIAARILDMNTDRTAGPLGRNGVIVFQGDRGLFEADPDGTGSHAVVRNVPDPPGECLSDSEHPCNYTGMTWSPDGTQLAFVFGEISAGLLGDMSIYVMDATTEEVRLLARCPARSGRRQGGLRQRSGSVVVSRRRPARPLLGVRPLPGRRLLGRVLADHRLSVLYLQGAGSTPIVGASRGTDRLQRTRLARHRAQRRHRLANRRRYLAGDVRSSERDPIGMVTGRHENHLLGDPRDLRRRRGRLRSATRRAPAQR